MLEILTADEMKQADAATIASGTSGFSLMIAAGQAVASQIAEKVETPCPVLVLCGPGNNGGDGFIAAAQLKKRGWPVRVACLVKKSALTGNTAKAAALWTETVEDLNSNLSVRDVRLVVDALFGTGFQGTIDPEIITLFDKLRARKAEVIAVDMPSGINATTGDMAQGLLKADLTVTFCRRKVAHMLYPSRLACGKIIRADIPVRDETIAGLKSQTFENHPSLWLKNFPLPTVQDHKYDRGHVAVYGGNVRTGAACLAAMASQKIGAGLVTIISKPDNRNLYAACRASIMVDVWNDMEEFKFIMRDARKNSVIIGPGAGSDIKDVVLTALSFNKSGVLDADVFSAFKDQPQELFSRLSTRYVLTPHAGEFERLFGPMEGNKLDRARSAAQKSNAIILLKGPDTIIAAPDGTAVISLNGPPTLATAGSGDVLSGLIGGLVAQGMPTFMAACAGCWLQGEAAKIHGLGLTAEDIIYHISQVLNSLFHVPADIA